MASSVLLKRSAVAGKIPLTTDLALGEIAINTYDGKLFLKRNNGSDSIREIGAVTVEKNGTAVATRRNINFIEGTNITLTVADDSANDEVDVTITATGGGGGNLDSLTDVVITTPANGDSLVYNGTNWENSPDISNTLGAVATILDPVTRQSNTSAIVAISVGTTAPTSPAIGDLWVDTN